MHSRVTQMMKIIKILDLIIRSIEFLLISCLRVSAVPSLQALGIVRVRMLKMGEGVDLSVQSWFLLVHSDHGVCPMGR